MGLGFGGWVRFRGQWFKGLWVMFIVQWFKGLGFGLRVYGLGLEVSGLRELGQNATAPNGE